MEYEKLTQLSPSTTLSEDLRTYFLLELASIDEDTHRRMLGMCDNEYSWDRITNTMLIQLDRDAGHRQDQPKEPGGSTPIRLLLRKKMSGAHSSLRSRLRAALPRRCQWDRRLHRLPCLSSRFPMTPRAPRARSTKRSRPTSMTSMTVYNSSTSRTCRLTSSRPSPLHHSAWDTELRISRCRIGRRAIASPRARPSEARRCARLDHKGALRSVLLEGKDDLQHMRQDRALGRRRRLSYVVVAQIIELIPGRWTTTRSETVTRWLPPPCGTRYHAPHKVDARRSCPHASRNPEPEDFLTHHACATDAHKVP